MNSDERRAAVARAVKSSPGPVTGGALAAMLGVTRQVIVSDIAVLRAGGEQIIATPSGYMPLPAVPRGRLVRVMTCRHESVEDARRELLIIVSNGGVVRDVIIEHPVYGEITGSLMLSAPEAVTALVERLAKKDSQMLSSVTDGVHMHTIEAGNEDALQNIERLLDEAGILI